RAQAGEELASAALAARSRPDARAAPSAARATRRTMVADLEEQEQEDAGHGEPQHLHGVLPVRRLPRHPRDVVRLVPALLHVVGDAFGDEGFFLGLEVVGARLRLPDLADERGEAEGLCVDAGDDLAVHGFPTLRTAVRAARASTTAGQLRRLEGRA